MEYSVPQHIDSNKIFLVNFSELEGRLDPHFYKSDFSVFHNQLKNQKFVRLGSVIKKITNGLDCRKYTKTGIVYLKVANVKKGELSLDDVQYVDMSAEGITKSIQLTKGNLLLTRKGTFGNTYCIKQNLDYIISSEIFYITINQNLINGDFLAIVLNSRIGQIQFDRNKIGAIMGSLSQNVVKDILIPIPSKIVQKQIIDKYNIALKLHRSKIALSKQKLASIDTYLLGVLGITLPKNDFQELNDRLFTVRFKDVVCNRFDPKSYCKKKNNLLDAVQKSSFDKYPLMTFIENECSGEWGEDVEETKLDMSQYTKCLVLRSTEFDNRYNLRLDNSRVKYRYILNSKLKKMDVKPFDLIIEKSGGSEDQPVGRIAILTEDVLKNNNIAYSNFLQKISVVGINPYYLYYYLKVMHNIGMTDFMQSQTNGIRNLIMSEYKKQIIITPVEEKQTEIVAHISAIRAEAKALEIQAEEVLTKAREEVEKMIMNKA